MIFYDNNECNVNFSIGMDIEFPVINSKGNCISAIPFIDGTKENPDICEGGNIQRDNVAIEIAIDYTYDCYSFINHMHANLQSALDILPKGYTLGPYASAIYPPKELEHEEAKEFQKKKFK